MKMKCIDVYNTALSDLCFDDTGAVSVIDDIDKRAVSTVNHIYRELFFKLYKTGFNPVNSIYDYIELPENVIFSCLIPGVAAKIAFDYGDGNLQSYFGSLYNQGLNKLNTTQKVISDVLPSYYEN